MNEVVASKVELDETFRLDLLDIDPDYNGILIIDTGGTVTIPNDDSATIFFGASPSSGAEGAATEFDAVEFTATLDAGVDVPVSAAWSTSPGTASGPTDYFNEIGDLSFDGTTLQQLTFDVVVVGDSLVELDEDFVLQLFNLSASGRNVILGSDKTYQITNDDSATIIFGASPSSGAEGEATEFDSVEFTATLGAGVDVPVSAVWSTSPDLSAPLLHKVVRQVFLQKNA